MGLSTLKISFNDKILDLSPEFNKNTLNYTINVENASKLDIEALANYEDASIEIEGNEKFKNGENTVTINVKKDNEIKTYTLLVNNTKIKTVSSIGAFFNNTWIVLLVSFCALVQSAIAVYFAVLAYKNSNTTK